MQKTQQDHTWENRAVSEPSQRPSQHSQGETGETPVYCESCKELLVFAMRDKEHTFSLGLSTVLDCLRIAETRGFVPHLPDTWWGQLR